MAMMRRSMMLCQRVQQAAGKLTCNAHLVKFCPCGAHAADSTTQVARGFRPRTRYHTFTLSPPTTVLLRVICTSLSVSSPHELSGANTGPSEAQQTRAMSKRTKRVLNGHRRKHVRHLQVPLLFTLSHLSAVPSTQCKGGHKIKTERASGAKELSTRHIPARHLLPS